MKDYLEYKSEKNHLFFQIEVDGCSVVTLQGRVGEPAKKRVKTYKTNNGCYKYYHKMLFKLILLTLIFYLKKIKFTHG